MIYRASVEIDVFLHKGMLNDNSKGEVHLSNTVYEISCILAVIFPKYQGYLFWEMICQMSMIDELYKIYSYRID